jgi:hypothetical protein
MGPRPELHLVGPPVPTPPRYFDGNLMAELAVQPQFQDQADRYNYHPTGYSAWNCYGYYPCGWWRFGPGCGGANFMITGGPVVQLGTW